MKYRTTRGLRLSGALRRGFVFIDVAMGLALLGLITFALIASLGRQQRAAQKLADARAATRVVEDALASLRAGRALPAEAGVELTRLSDPVPPGYAWVRGSARVGTAAAELVAFLPATAVPSEAADAGGTP